MTTQETCKERIQDRFYSREQDIKAMLTVYLGEEDELDSDNEYDAEILKLIEDDDIGEYSLHEFALGINVKKVINITLSTGGPGDYLECFFDESDEMYRVVYHFIDWFDHAEMKVDEDSAVWEYAQMMCESL